MVAGSKCPIDSVVSDGIDAPLEWCVQDTTGIHMKTIRIIKYFECLNTFMSFNVIAAGVVFGAAPSGATPA